MLLGKRVKRFIYLWNAQRDKANHHDLGDLCNRDGDFLHWKRVPGYRNLLKAAVPAFAARPFNRRYGWY